jgi:hypothetical protein
LCDGFEVTIQEAYAELGLDASSATPNDARSRFRELIRAHHPDGKPPQEQALANETTRVIVEACALLRMEGFPRLVAGTHPNGLRYEQQAGIEPGADPLAWVDDVLRDSLRNYLIGAASLAFGVRFAVGAWTMGWQIMRPDLRRF